MIKLIYALIFLCFTISTCLNQSIDDNNECSKSIFIRIWDIWYSFLCLILILSLFIDHIKRQNIISLEIINALQISLIIIFIIFVVLGKITKLKCFLSKISFPGHVQVYYHLWWSSSSSIELTRSALLSIVFIDICPISIAIFITINSLKKHRSWRRVHTNTIISSV